MELILTHHTAIQISISCDRRLSHIFDVSIIPAPTHFNDPPELTNPQSYGTAVYQTLFPRGTLARGILDGEPERHLLVLASDNLDADGWEHVYGPNATGPDDFPVSACYVVRGLPADQRIASSTLMALISFNLTSRGFHAWFFPPNVQSRAYL